MQHDIRSQCLVRSGLALVLAPLGTIVLLAFSACGGDSPTDPPVGTGGTREPATLVVTPDALALHALGDSAQLAAVVRDDAGDELAGASIAWAALDPGVATVSTDGWVVAQGNGTARVVASAGTLADTVEVEVAQVAAALALSPEQKTLAQGDTLRLSVVVSDSNGVDIAAPAVEWSSTAADVAAVDTAGLVTALRGGTAVVSAATDGISVGATFTVLDLIAFESDRTGDFEIYVMNPDGSGQVNLTNDPGDDFRPVWSPDGTKIVFESDRDGNNELYVMNADGSGQVNLTNDAGSDIDAAWSPDGSRIAFTSSRDGNQEIYVMNADGTDLLNVTNDDALDRRPVWLPDGSAIAFETDRDGRFGIYVVNPNGDGLDDYTDDAADDVDPVWSPDGTKIAFVRRFADFDIWLMNANGAGLDNLTGASGIDVEPAWSPDGTKIAFQSARDGNYDIWVMSAEGGDQSNLTTAPGFDGGPLWSPDGTMIAFVSSRDGNNEIYVMAADGSGPVNLTNTAGDDREFSWRPRP